MNTPNAEEILRDYIGGMVLERAALVGEIARLRALVPVPSPAPGTTTEATVVSS